MKDLGNVDEILGCQVHVDLSLGTITMNQRKYTTGILTKFLESHQYPWLDTPADNKLIFTQEMEQLMMQRVQLCAIYHTER